MCKIGRRSRIIGGFRIDRKCTASPSCVDDLLVATIEKESLLDD